MNPDRCYSDSRQLSQSHDLSILICYTSVKDVHRGFETLFDCKIVKSPLKVRRRVKGGKLQESSAQVATSQSCCV